MQKIYIAIIAVCAFIICSSLMSFAYDSEVVHPQINKSAVYLSEIDSILNNMLNFEDGVDTKFSGFTVHYLIGDGGSTEDLPPRWINHFHDPLKPWSAAGLLAPFSGYDSSIVWAQKKWQNLEGTFSWDTARKSYYLAITTGSDGEFEKTFRSIGQVMHLLADSSVPAHVRNDLHPFDPELVGTLNLLSPSIFIKYDHLISDPYEKWAQEHCKGPDSIYYQSEKVDLSIFNNMIPTSDTDFASASIPISALWDQNQYTSTTAPQNLTWGESESIGLSEFTNANFVSFSTNFSDYPHPAYEDTDLSYLEWTNPELIDAEDGKIDKKLYLRAQNGPLTGVRIASIGYFDYALLNMGLNSLISPVLDDKVHEDYASVLIPRAVGYSAALLDYFFRGTIEVKPIRPEDIEVSMIEGVGNRISGLRVDLLNSTMDQLPNETMGEGLLVAVVKYTTGNVSEYSVSEEVIINVQNNNFVSHEIFNEYEFTFSNSIPLSATDTEIQIVFKGTLGNEQDIAVAVGRAGLFDSGIEITPPSEFVYSIIDGGDSQEFTKIKASVRNDPAGKQIQDGTLTAVAMYRERINYDPNLSDFEPPSYSDSLSDFAYSVSDPISINGMSTDHLAPDEYSFDFTAQPVPAGITDLYLYIVFEGNLLNGQEVEADTIAGFKDLSEPDHRVFWNSTDQIVFSYLYDNNNNDVLDSLFYLDDFKNSPPDYWSDLWCTFVDLNCNGITSEINSGNPELYVDPYDISYQLSFSGVDPQTNQVNLVQVAEINNLPPGEHSRIIILTDRSYDQLVWMTEDITRHYIPEPLPDKPAYDDLNTTDYLYSYGVVNQLSDVTWEYTELEPRDVLYRGVGQHGHFAEYICIAPLGNECLYLGNERPNPADLTPHPATINF
ncbi:hypothetical protein ACFLYW_01880 [Thermodesulfobacteriota bacterium]